MLSVVLMCMHSHVALQSFLSSPKTLIKFASIRILSQLAMRFSERVSPANVDIEQLVSDGNRNIATLAITTLLKTGNESSVDRLLKQITGYVSDISDEFKVIVVDAVRSLCLKFPSKHSSMLEFFGRVLREEGGLAYKEATIESICGLIEKIPACKEIALGHLCEFIEDCEYPQLIVRVIHLLGEEGAGTAQPSKIVRYIYNRLALENVRVRVACVDALLKIGLKAGALCGGIIKILTPLCDDPDDETRDAAVVSISLLKNQDSQLVHQVTDFEKSFDLEYLEGQLMEYLSSNDYSQPFDMHRVPEMSRSQVFSSAELDMSLEHLVPAAAASAPDSPADVRGRQGLSQAELLSIPAFSSFGKLLKSSLIQSLTDPDAEFDVQLVKHWFAENVVFEFVVLNTVKNMLLRNVKVVFEELEGDFNPTALIAIPQISFKDGALSAFVSCTFDLMVRPIGTFTPSLKFKVVECDADTYAPISNAYNDEQYPLNSFEIGFCDYVSPGQSDIDFATEWNKLGGVGNVVEETETFALTALGSMHEAVQALVEAFGATAIGNTDQVDPYASQHTLLLSGSLLCPSGPFLCRCRLAMDPGVGCTLELTVKSDCQISEIVLSILG